MKHSAKIQLVFWVLFAASAFFWAPYFGKCPTGNTIWVYGFLAFAVIAALAAASTILVILRFVTRLSFSHSLNLITLNLLMMVLGMCLTVICWAQAGIEFCE